MEYFPIKSEKSSNHDHHYQSLNPEYSPKNFNPEKWIQKSEIIEVLEERLSGNCPSTKLVDNYIIGICLSPNIAKDNLENMTESGFIINE